MQLKIQLHAVDTEEPRWRSLSRGGPKGFKNEGEENEHGDQENALQGAGNPPREGAGEELGESIFYPVGEEDSEVESRELHTDVCSRSVSDDWEAREWDIHTPRVALRLNSD
jgi:hypothetical protein